MNNSFKNFERLRYRISTDISKIYENSNNRTDEMRNDVSNTVFAAIFSALISEVALGSNPLNFSIKRTIALVIVFIVAYAILYISYNRAKKHLHQFCDERKLNKVDKSIQSMIQIQKDFDNIASDSILFARDYKKEYEALEATPDNKSLRYFYYYEIMHYLEKAVEITALLIKNQNSCIRTMSNAHGVDIYRVENMKTMINEINAFLDAKEDEITQNNQRKTEIEHNRAELTRIIKTL